jgi:hypothetical protein
MMLFDNEDNDRDWFDVCPNSNIDLPDHEKMGVFDLGRLFLLENDRAKVADAIHTAQCSRQYFILLMVRSNSALHEGFFFAARELYQKIPDKLLSSVLAFSHGGGSRAKLLFPEKHYKIPKSLMGVFGLRSNQLGWFNKLADNESFVRLVGNQIKPSDWKHIPLYDTTLLLSPPKEATAPLLENKKGATLW